MRSAARLLARRSLRALPSAQTRAAVAAPGAAGGSREWTAEGEEAAPVAARATPPPPPSSRSAPPPPPRTYNTTRAASAATAAAEYAAEPPRVTERTQHVSHTESRPSATATARTQLFERDFSHTRMMLPAVKLLPQPAQELAELTNEAGSRYTDLQVKAELMEEGKKSVLAAWTLFHMDGGGSKTSAETKALCEPEYAEYLLRISEARHAAATARVEFESLKKQLDLVRTYESSRRAEISIL